MLADTMNAMAAFIGTYVDLPAEHRDVVALWCMYSHCFPHQEFSTCPYMLITSAEKASGKTTLMDAAAKLVREPLVSSNITPAMVGRVVNGRTLLLDELDTVYSRADDAGKELASILNGGFHVSGSYDRLIPDKRGRFHAASFPTFGPKMLVGIASEYPDTLVSRCIHIQMERKDDGSMVQRARERIMVEQAAPILVEAAKDATALGRLRFLDQMPDASGRTLDVWEPLLSLAGYGGQDWQVRALLSFHAIVDGAALEPTTAQRLLRDCRAAFDDTGAEYLRTVALIRFLVTMGEGWEVYAYGREITPQALGRQLAKYSIRPAREAGTGRAIYYRYSFEKAWARYL